MIKSELFDQKTKKIIFRIQYNISLNSNLKHQFLQRRREVPLTPTTVHQRNIIYVPIQIIAIKIIQRCLNIKTCST